MFRDSLSLYRTRGKRYFGIAFAVTLLGLATARAPGQEDPPGDMAQQEALAAEQADSLIQFACENIIANYKHCLTPHVYELALRRLGGLHLKYGRWEEAARYYETYRLEFPQFNTTSIILYNLVEIYESMGEPAIAIDVCEEFIQTCPEDRRIDRIIAKRDELTGSNK